jgi:hypothetical protein
MQQLSILGCKWCDYDLAVSYWLFVIGYWLFVVWPPVNPGFLTNNPINNNNK